MKTSLKFVILTFAAFGLLSAGAATAKAPTTTYVGNQPKIETKIFATPTRINHISVRTKLVCESGYKENKPYTYGKRKSEGPIPIKANGTFRLKLQNKDNNYILLFRGKRTGSKITGSFGVRFNVFDACHTGKSYGKYKVPFSATSSN